MAPGLKRKLSLPSSLLRELDIHQEGGHGRSKRQRSRKDQRKATRTQKRYARSSQLRQSAQPIRPASHQASHEPQDEPNISDDQFTEDDLSDEEEAVDEGTQYGSDENEFEEPSKSHRSKSERKKLSQDDIEIAELEKKLGLKGKKKLPKSFDEDGLSGLLESLDRSDNDDDEPEQLSRSKQRIAADEWLAQKRRKAQAVSDATAAAAVSIMPDVDENVDNMDVDEDGDKYDEETDIESLDDEFEGFSDTDEETEKEEPIRQQRENPYVAPTTNVARYVPPSLRKQSGSNDQVEAQLQRRIQGLINRLTNDNMIGILKDITDLYQTHPRQIVTSTLVDIILMLVCSPEKRPDSFFTMIAGFIAAVHKTMGVAVSAQFLQQLVETLDKRAAVASGNQSDSTSKHLVALLSELYNMQVIGCNLIFDYVRMFLKTLSELNTELLLRIIQLSGPSLRRDDPRALGDIVNHIRPDSAKDTSVRTRFMIDEMEKLHSNKAKAVARNKELAEQRTQIRKRIGALKGSHDVQPLRVGLSDIRDSETHGKWWLVGASWSGNQSGQLKRKIEEDQDDDEDNLADETINEVDDDLGIPDLWQLARDQGFNTEVRQRIFVALHAATDCGNADLLVQKLRLNKHQRKEIPEVIVRSGERQNVYNHYYALLADKFSGEKEMKFQFRRCLTIRFKKMGEDVDTGDGDEIDDDDNAADEDVRWLYNTAKLYAFLVVWQSLKLVDVFKYRNLAALQEKAHVFTELLLLTVLQECKRDKLMDIFGGLVTDVDVGRGVQYFLKRYVRKTQLLDDKKAKKTVKGLCDTVLDLLESTLARKALE
ncbi:hypothetical protein F5Y19DRAFT_170147 [Xylariaceae sp. FL1651]|nr:hypothetical protein F5Y19DRAFT_170147 [Xylariaceae sp. FL1651]